MVTPGARDRKPSLGHEVGFLRYGNAKVMTGSDYTPWPDTATTATVQAIWTDLLGVDVVGPDDDFFELGGHSLMAAAVVTHMNERLGLDLPPLALFEAPTPAEMAELIAELRTGRRTDGGGVTPFIPSWVIPLQREGRERPVFVFPAGHDEVTALAIEAQVAVHVGRDRPFWGFGRDDPQLDGARASGIPGLAAEYEAQMRTIQGEGPFLLYANCAGGPYAWETAARLLAAGEGIAGMLFYEVPLDPNLTAPLPHFTPALMSEPRMPDGYRPQPLPVALTLVMTEFWRRRRWSVAWRAVALGGTRIVVISDQDVSDPSRREARIAGHVRDWIERAEARPRDG